MQVKGVILLDYLLPAIRIAPLALLDVDGDDLWKREAIDSMGRKQMANHAIDARPDKSTVTQPTGNDMGNPPV